MPIDHRLVVVFDTNSYIQLGHPALQEVTRLERGAQVFALASPWPCLELLAGCRNPNPKGAGQSRNALRKVWEHTGYRTPDGARIRMQEAGEVTLTRGLFGIDPEEPLQDGAFLGNLIVAAIEMELGEFLKSHALELEAIARRVAEEEESFMQMGGRWGRPDSTTPKVREALRNHATISIIAAGLVQMLADRYQVDLGEIDSCNAVQRLVYHFPVAMHFMRDLLDDSLGTGVTPGGGNSAWDLKVAFHAGPGASVGGVPTMLVSDDGRLRRAAEAANEPHRVATMQEYLAILRDRDGVRDRSMLLRTARPN